MIIETASRNLNELIEALFEKGKCTADRHKKWRSSAKCFALDVHDKNSVEELLPAMYLEPKARRHDRIEDRLGIASHHKRRNVKQEVDQILRLAFQEGLIPDPETLPVWEGDEPQSSWRHPPFRSRRA